MHKKVEIIILFTIVILYSCSCSNDESPSVNKNKKEQSLFEYQQGEEYPIGKELTVNVGGSTDFAFGRSVPGLSRLNEKFFGIGNALFRTAWVASPASTTAVDGLGPTFNARSCSSCHFLDGRGKPNLINDEGSKGFLIRISQPGTNEHGGPLGVPGYGDQIQDQSNIFLHPDDNSIMNVNEAEINVSFEFIKGTYADGTEYELRKPVYSLVNEKFGSLENVMMSPRIGQQVAGLGFIDALSEESLLANADENDTDGDGISGKANYVWDVREKKLSIGKFGWKANQPNLHQQVAGAFNGDMGLTTSIFPNQNCPDPQKNCQEAITGVNHDGLYEVTDRNLNSVMIYSTSLAVPIRRNFKKENVLNGKGLFYQMDCAKCHVDNFKTGKYPFNEVLENRTIRPFSDFLLHDMGPELADNRPDFLATGTEWRTQPLWGLGYIEDVNKHTFLLHDGRARNIEEAILWHGGEAQKSKEKFTALSKTERDNVISFLKSL